MTYIFPGSFIIIDIIKIQAEYERAKSATVIPASKSALVLHN
jgi:hypothetical protein